MAGLGKVSRSVICITHMAMCPADPYRITTRGLTARVHGEDESVSCYELHNSHFVVQVFQRRHLKDMHGLSILITGSEVQGQPNAGRPSKLDVPAEQPAGHQSGGLSPSSVTCLLVCCQPGYPVV